MQMKKRPACHLPSTKISITVFVAAALTQGCGPAELGAAVDDEGSAAAQAPLAVFAADHLAGHREKLGMDLNHRFQLARSFRDELGQTHLRFEQRYRGVKVFAAEAVVHVGADGSALGFSNGLRGGVSTDVRPSLRDSDARAIAHRDLSPRGGYASAPTAELVLYPQINQAVKESRMRGPRGELNAMDIEDRVAGYALAYHVHTELENGALETGHTDYIIDAHSGEILKKWSSLRTAASSGTGNSEFSGSVTLGTNTIAAGFELRDVARSMNFVTYNLNHGTSGTGTIYTDADNGWGDGANYIAGGSTTNANGQTAGVDAHYGVAKTFDYYSNVHARNGIDGAGTATYSRVHYSSNYVNAFWSDSCFCMTYGDGDASYKVLTSLDVAGHEMTHGVTSRTAKLVYSGESGGLNEAMSDIHGTMTEFYARGGSGSTIGNTGGNWLIGEQLNATPLRYMYKPSKDGASKDAWYAGIGSIDVHYSSGPLNRAFYFLSQGSSSVATSDFYSSYLPAGMTGIGNDKAARIAYRALTAHMTASTNYAGARTAFQSAASALYGATSAEYTAVGNAFTAINVGPPVPLTPVAEVEPNNTTAAPQTITINGSSVSGTISATTDTDYYKVTLAPGKTLAATLTPNGTSDYDLYIYSNNGTTQLASSIAGTGAVDSASVTNSTTAAVVRYVRVKYYGGLTGASGTYTLNLTF